MTDGQDMYGTSMYIICKSSDKIKLFGRYDDLNSSTINGTGEPWQIDQDGQLFMAGLEYSPVKGVKFSPNYRLWAPDNESLPNINSIYINCELKF